MKETSEIHESPEKRVTKPPEKKIDTFDDLKASDKLDRINTFDDIAKKQGSDSSIKTFDDIANSKEGAAHQEISESSVNDSPETSEKSRINQASEDIKQNEWMKPEKWKTLDNHEKRIALDHSGDALGDAYRSPEPPLYLEKTEPNELGKYGDGFSYDASKDKIIGSDYGVRMNEEGLAEGNEKLFGDDPKAALETYAHEFRHSYQNEQAHAYDKGLRVDDQVKAKEWSENLKDYKEPPNPELAKADSEKYFNEYETYRNQPVEKDAREFGEKLKSEIYIDTQDKKGK